MRTVSLLPNIDGGDADPGIEFTIVDYSSMVKQRSLGPDNLDDGSDVIPGPCGQRRRDALAGEGDSEVDARERVAVSQR